MKKLILDICLKAQQLHTMLDDLGPVSGTISKAQVVDLLQSSVRSIKDEKWLTSRIPRLGGRKALKLFGLPAAVHGP
jgi:hypothetical protein